MLADDMKSQSDPEIMVSDLHRRITGVSTTIRTLMPYLAAREATALVSNLDREKRGGIGIVGALKTCCRLPRSKPFRIWHARRNNEMFWALVFKHIFRCRLKVVLTSCALRRHSWVPRQLISAMDAVIATSDEAASYLDEVTAVIPHGVDCERFHPITDRELALREFGVLGKYGIGICGRVRPEKGTHFFVEAMLEVLPDHPEFIACIVGRTAPEHAAFRARLVKKIEAASLAERILWMDELPYDQMPRFHAAMTLCVAPPLYEGFGVVPLEAMASGAAVVASRTGCYPEVIVSGVTGELVPCGDQQALVSALRKVMKSPERLLEMGRAGRERVLEHYSAQREAERIIEVYQQMWNKAA